VFANVVLADEINRASPKTQSALLEVMEEQHVTIDARAHAVPRPFIVIATQNPIDLEGTYRLPEAQLDRFLIRTGIGYPSPQEETQILAGQKRRLLPEQLTPVMTGDEVRAMIAIANEVHAAPSLCQYIVQLGAATRSMGALRLGVSPRGNLALLRAARAYAAASGRMYVTPEDVKALAVPVLAHRLILDADADLRRTDPKSLVAEALASVPVPHATTG
jgi:MoxR-like ATPase